MKRNKDIKNKQDLIINSILIRITDFQLSTNDNDLLNWVEDLRQNIVNFSDGITVRDTCSKCGCNEFLCGHNARI